MTQGTTPSDTEAGAPRHPIVLAWLAIVFLVCLIVAIVWLTISMWRQGSAAATPAASAPAETPEIYTYSVNELSALAGYLSDLDEGRLRAAPPVQWCVAPRSKDCVARFVFDPTRQSPLPRITIESRDAGFPQLRDVNRANLHEFLAQFTRTLGDDAQPTVPRDLLVLVLGDVPCLAYTVNKQFRTGSRRFAAERHVVVTLRHGRLYTVSLDVYTGKLDDYRADVWAVVAGLQFPQPAATEPEEPSGSEPNQTVGDGAGESPPGTH